MGRLASAARTALPWAIALLCAALPGCAPADAAKPVEESAAARLEQLADLDGPSIDAVAAALEERVDTDAYGVDAGEFCRSWLSGFDYEILGARVEGDRAEVAVDVTCRSMDAALALFALSFSEYRSGEEFRASTAEEAVERTGELILEAVRLAPFETTALALPYELRDGEWAPAEGFEEQLARALTATSR